MLLDLNNRILCSPPLEILSYTMLPNRGWHVLDGHVRAECAGIKERAEWNMPEAYECRCPKHINMPEAHKRPLGIALPAFPSSVAGYCGGRAHEDTAAISRTQVYCNNYGYESIMCCDFPIWHESISSQL